MSTNENIMYSVVVPVFKEEEIIEEFFLELNKVMLSLNETYEILFVDDQTDIPTVNKLKSICDQHPEVQAVILSRNFGHQVALTAGIDMAKGEAVIMLDGDLQHPPTLLPELIKHWKDGYDVVYTVRKDTEDSNSLRKLTSFLFYYLMSKISNVDVGFNCADFRLMSRKAVDGLKQIKEHSRFIRGLVKWIGYKQIAVSFEFRKREKGATKYNIHKLIKFAVDGILPFSETPIRLITMFGFVVAIISILYIFSIFYYYFFSEVIVPGWSSILGAILFIGSVQIVMIGIVGEYIAKIFSETKNRPLYLLDEIYNKEKKRQ